MKTGAISWAMELLHTKPGY